MTSVEKITVFGCLMLSEGLLNDHSLHRNVNGREVEIVGNEFA